MKHWTWNVCECCGNFVDHERAPAYLPREEIHCGTQEEAMRLCERLNRDWVAAGNMMPLDFPPPFSYN